MRDYKRRRYLFAFIISASIFALGFFFGFLMDLQRIDYFTSLNEIQKINLRSIQLQYELLQNIDTGNQCKAFRFVFDSAIQELEKNRERLESYERQSTVRKEDFNMLKREYTLSQINFWQISKNFKKTCPDDSDFVTVLYFFSDTKNCPDCEKQAAVLNYYKDKLNENLLIFAIDETFEDKESLIKLLKQAYEINSYPSIIIGEKKYGLLTSQDMREILCNIYSDESTKSKVC
ncbi:MAG: hypothetical protein KatS3mg002_0109 [Candidatus Woesearchaeota archaeon]|nr:MAG: hypothetical protein KatS3mg002_0109 [Candidatus Woesearchaeota archaeon]